MSQERIPLLKDHHTHPYLYASLASCPDLRFVEEKGRALDLIGHLSAGDGLESVGMNASRIQDKVNVVIGWNDSLYSFSPDELDRFPPLIVMNASLHSFAMNGAARELIAPRHPELIARLDDREWIERNAALVMGFVMGVRPLSTSGLASFYRQLAEAGVWYAEEMTLWDEAETGLFEDASLTGRSSFWATPDLFRGLHTGAASSVRGVKIFADGALGARTAALSGRYLGGEEGILIYDDEELREQLDMAVEAGKEAAVHAIGDRAIDQVVDAVAGMKKRSLVTRIEHCQFITLETARRARELGIVLSMQPNFSMESDCYRDRLSPCYLETNNPFRMLIDQAGFVPGEDLIFGSDGMPHGASYALRSAFFPPFPGQRLTLPEFVAGYCMPDLTHGYIDVTIDHDGRKIDAEVTLTD